MNKISIYLFLFLSLYIYADQVDIKAEHFYANDIGKTAYFEGNAQIKQQSNEFNASKVIVYFNNKKKAIRYEAEGSVKFDITEKGVHYQGRADSISYAPDNSKYNFLGNIILKDLTNNRKITAHKISLDLKTGLADIKGVDKEPVHFIFEIEDRK